MEEIIQIKPLEEIIQDDELERLTKLHPPKEVLGKHYDYWADGNLETLYMIEFFSSSPANSRRVESGILPRLLKEAVRYDGWVAYRTDGAVEKATDNTTAYGGMVRPLIHSDRLYCAPTEGFIEFVRKRVEKLDGIKRYHLNEFFRGLRVLNPLKEF